MNNAVEQCPLCLSVNNLTFFGEFDAWECWCCGIRYWISPEALEAYCLLNDKTKAEGTVALNSADPSVIFAFGQIT